MSESIVGIDLSTHNIYATYIGNTRSERNTILPIWFQGEVSFPAYLLVDENGNKIISNNLKQCFPNYLERTVYEINHLIGNKFQDQQVQSLIGKVDFKITHDASNDPIITIDSKTYSPVDFFTQIFKHVIKNYHDCSLNETNKCVIAVPTFFNDNQIKATEGAARSSGFNEVKFISAPIAAAYEFHRNDPIDKVNILVFDFGESSLDVSIVNIDGNKFTLKGNVHSSEVSGSKIDDILMNYTLNEIRKKEEDFEPKSLSKMKMLYLRRECEKAKCYLSVVPGTYIYFPSMCKNLDRVIIKRHKFEYLIGDEILVKMEHTISRLMRNVGLTEEDIYKVQLVGGCSKIPIVFEILE